MIYLFSMLQNVLTLGISKENSHEAAISEAQSGEERRGEKTSGYPRQLIDLTAPIQYNTIQYNTFY